jgi:integrase
MARLLDQNTVDALTLADGSFVFDSEPSLRGFGVRIRKDAKGRTAKTYFVQYRTPDRLGQRRRTLGNAARMKAGVARKMAAAWIAELEKGNDPAVSKDKERMPAKFSAAVKDYLEAKDNLRPASLKNATLYLTSPKYFGPLHDLAVNRIERSDVTKCLDAIKKASGNTTALCCRAWISAFYGWAIEGGLADQNPVVGSRKFIKADPRARVLTSDELRSVWNAADPNKDFGRILRLLILLGARRQEIGSLKWSEVDLKARTITISGDRSKNHQSCTLPLMPAALDILKSVPRIAGSDFVFAGRRGFNDWTKRKKLLNDGIAEWNIHDVRRSFRTGLGKLKVPPHVAERVINHVKKDLEKVYDQYDYQAEIFSALKRWHDHVMSVTGHNVIPLKRAARTA